MPRLSFRDAAFARTNSLTVATWSLVVVPRYSFAACALEMGSQMAHRKLASMLTASSVSVWLRKACPAYRCCQT